MRIDPSEISAQHSTDGVTITMSHGAMNALASLLEVVDLSEYSMNPGVMGVSDALGQECASVGYALLAALNKL